MRLLDRILGRDVVPDEIACPRCGVPAPEDALECAACGWDLREGYRDPVSGESRDPAR